MDRMVYPVEEPDFETLLYDVETSTQVAVDQVCQIFGVPSLHVPLDREAIDAILAPLYVDTGMTMARMTEERSHAISHRPTQ